MRAKETDAISGMHMPSGENLWASPADDEEDEEEEEDMKKEALGLTSVPGEQQKDYQLEQPFHIKDPDNVGVIDVESVIDVPPMNNAKDSEPEKKMEELLEDLIKQLESRGYADKAELVKSAYPGQAGGVPHPQWKSRPKLSPPSKPAKSEPEPNYGTSDPSKDEFGADYESFASIEDMISSGLLTKQQADWLRRQSLTQSFSPEVLRKELGMDIAYAKQLSDLLIEEAQSAQRAHSQQAAKSRSPSGWDSYASAGEGQKALSNAWQANPPEGYTSDFSSFQQWYLKKYQEIGRHFGPDEALSMIGGPAEEAAPAEEVKSEVVGITDEDQPAEETSEEPARPTEESVKGLVEQFLTDIMSGSARVRGFLGTRNRATKQRIRNLGGVDGAADAIIEMAGGWENLAKYDTARDQDKKLFSDLEQVAWRLLKEARRAQRRGRADDDELDRSEARSKRAQFLEKIANDNK